MTFNTNLINCKKMFFIIWYDRKIKIDGIKLTSWRRSLLQRALVWIQSSRNELSIHRSVHIFENIHRKAPKIRIQHKQKTHTTTRIHCTAHRDITLIIRIDESSDFQKSRDVRNERQIIYWVTRQTRKIFECYSVGIFKFGIRLWMTPSRRV